MSFLRWIGGKVNLISQLGELFPNMSNINGYIEPFLGGGSIFFYIMENYRSSLEGKPIYLSDINGELINCYRIVRDDIEELIPLLENHQKMHNGNYYNKIRNIYPPGNDLSNTEKAAMFIYLNKTCYGGVWRVNSDGKFNMPIGNKEKVIFDIKELVEYSSLLKCAKLNVMSFENILRIKDINNYFVYMDPPYFIISGGQKEDFTRYTKDRFHLSKRVMIPKIFKELDKLGCKVMMSNSYSPIINKEFKDFNIKILDTHRMKGIVLAKTTKEDMENAEKLQEVVVTNYKEIKKQKDIYESWN